MPCHVVKPKFFESWASPSSFMCPNTSGEIAKRCVQRRSFMSAGKILVIDDDPQIRRVMKVILTGERYEVVEARSGEAALLKFREFLPDLVLLVLNIPGFVGLQTSPAIP